MHEWGILEIIKAAD